VGAVGLIPDPLTREVRLRLVPAIRTEVERLHPFEAIGKLEDLRIFQRQPGIALTGLPMLFHGAAGKLEIFRITLVDFRAVNKVRDIEDLIDPPLPRGF
jgi:hypothetical protein